jgi:hypothetical protein
VIGRTWWTLFSRSVRTAKDSKLKVVLPGKLSWPGHNRA